MIVPLQSKRHLSNLIAAILLLVLCGGYVSAQSRLSPQDQTFLDDLEHRSFQYFWDQADPATGLIPDRARMDGSSLDDNHRNVASTAATGFGLTAISIATERGWVTRTQARERVRATLNY